MPRIPTIMAAAGAAALTTLAVAVAGPAMGDDGGAGAYPRTSSSLAACLSAHGVTGAPTDDTLKPWLGRRLARRDETVTAAVEACTPKDVPPAEQAADERAMRSCLAHHGADVPDVNGGDLKRWIVEHQQEPATAAAMKACHLVIGDHPAPGDCAKAAPAGDGAGKPGDERGADDEATITKPANAART